MGRVTSPPLLEQSCPRSGGLLGAKCGAGQVQPTRDGSRTACGSGEVGAALGGAAKLRPEPFAIDTCFTWSCLGRGVRYELQPEHRLSSGEGDAGTCPAQRGGRVGCWKAVECLRCAQRLALGERYLRGEKRARFGRDLAGGQLREYPRRCSTIPGCHPSSSGLFQRSRAGFACKAGSTGFGASCDGHGCRRREGRAGWRLRGVLCQDGAFSRFRRWCGEATAAGEQGCQSNHGKGKTNGCCLPTPITPQPVHRRLRVGVVRGHDGVRVHL